MEPYPLGSWALILGASSGFGGACAVELARRGMDVFAVHLDRKATMANVESIRSEIERHGRRAVFFNLNAADPQKRSTVLGRVNEILQAAGREAHVQVLLHSIAFGTLRPFIGPSPAGKVSKAQMDMTVDVMAHSLVYWVQDLVEAGHLKRGSRVLAMTSAGSHRVWPAYGAISAAKAAIEAHVRQLAVELAPLGITVNAIRAGVTDTPALRKIPMASMLLEHANARNPSGRMTTPTDIAAAVCLLAGTDSQWITGNVIAVDGGEDLI